jgi:hypothetical protein
MSQFKEFVKKAELHSDRIIYICEDNLQMLNWELNKLYGLLNKYTNKTVGDDITYRKKMIRIDQIRDDISSVNEHMEYYRNVLNAEEKEMARIYKAYGEYLMDDGHEVYYEEDYDY